MFGRNTGHESPTGVACYSSLHGCKKLCSKVAQDDVVIALTINETEKGKRKGIAIMDMWLIMHASATWLVLSR